ncbi:NfeD family protein [Leptolyngbya sp. PCC 6406]|uniref:NfeD family protein n=1 Tax=Leptolyngbya sp. PCC 6406 TaxID=1173264 RepID=UPI0002AC61A9|nr:NfeD family protein [Leptolyngbya sp. PCC 6406]
MNLLSALFKSYGEDEDARDDTLLVLDFGGPVAKGQVPLELLATVTDSIAPGRLGHVIFQGVQWRAYAEGNVPISTGTTVRVVGRQSNVLRVEPY